MSIIIKCIRCMRFVEYEDNCGRHSAGGCATMTELNLTKEARATLCLTSAEAPIAIQKMCASFRCRMGVPV
jgi:hypothetical protein